MLDIQLKLTVNIKTSDFKTLCLKTAQIILELHFLNFIVDIQVFVKGMCSCSAERR